GTEVIFTSAGFDEIEGEFPIEAGKYLLLLSADKSGWGITLNTEMEGEITINLTTDQGVSGGLDEYDTLITENIGETNVEFSYEKDVKNRGLFFKLIEITDEDGQPYLERNTITTRVITPDNEIFTEDTTEGTTGRIMPSGPMWGWFIFNLDVGNANEGKWRFEGEYQMEGWNREWDITITETYVLY
ncbi:MAG: hypothetical protein V3U20_10670, partial [Thermoplasmata archaeon]